MKEHYRLTAEMARKDVFSAINGIAVHSVEKDRAIVGLEIHENSKNLLGIVHGGAMYTMADCATGLAAHTDGRSYVTQGSSMHYLKNRREGTIYATGQVIHRGKTTCLVRVEITDDSGALLASGEFTFFCLDANQ